MNFRNLLHVRIDGYLNFYFDLLLEFVILNSEKNYRTNWPIMDILLITRPFLVLFHENFVEELRIPIATI